jgi:hypothetical protein
MARATKTAGLRLPGRFLFNPTRCYSFSWASTAGPLGQGDTLAGTHDLRQTDDSARRARAKIPVRILPQL